MTPTSTAGRRHWVSPTCLRRPAMRPDPGRDILEEGLAALTPDARARIASDLRARGVALAWDQLERAGPMDPVTSMLFLLERLYPEMPDAHREQLRRGLTAEVAAGTWVGPSRPADRL